MKIVCISDTHGDHSKVQLPAGDVLIHAGDICAHGTEQDYLSFLSWFSDQPHQHKIFIAGNHDTYLEQQPVKTLELAKQHKVTYLNDSGITLNGIKVWGSPITPRFYNWSFMRDAGEEIEKHWRLIPNNVHILVTHGPPFGVLDEVEREDGNTEHTGCPSLLKSIDSVGPLYHVFGHIHECYGEKTLEGVQYLNVSTMDNNYVVRNAPVEIEL